MANLFGIDLGFSLGNFDIGFKLFLILVVVLVGVIIGVIFFFVSRMMVYNKKVVIYEKTGATYDVTGKDRARIVKLGNGGEEILYLLKRKVYRTAYGRKIGREYWFAIGPDGYWYNFVLGDLDTKMGMLDIEPIDRDMRYMHTAIRKNIQDRYRKIGFMEKYGPLLINGITALIFLIGLWLLIDQLAEVANSLSSAVQSAQKVTEASSNILASLDNLKLGGGSGLVPAPV